MRKNYIQQVDELNSLGEFRLFVFNVICAMKRKHKTSLSNKIYRKYFSLKKENKDNLINFINNIMLLIENTDNSSYHKVFGYIKQKLVLMD